MNRVLYIIIIILCIVIVAILCVLMHKVNNTSLEVDKFKMQQESSDASEQNNRTLEKVSLYVDEERKLKDKENKVKNVMNKYHLEQVILGYFK